MEMYVPLGPEPISERLKAWYARMERVAQARQARPPKKVKAKRNKWIRN